MNNFAVLIVAVSLFVSGPVARAEILPEKLFDIEFNPITEMSGIVKSKRFEDVFWVHNDSGDSARLFAINGKGKVLYPGYMNVYGEVSEEGKSEWAGHKIYQAANLDWEDIAVDEEMIYIAEMGNNGNARRDLGVYVVPEPNPRQVGGTRILKYLPIRYPEQQEFPAKKWHYDSEAIFVFKGKLYFITKHRPVGQIDQFEKGAILYRLDTKYTDGFNTLERVDDHGEMTAITGADMSPNGNQLAVVGYQQLWIFDRPLRGDKLLSSAARFLALDVKHTGQIEAVAWQNNETILIGNEGRELFSIAAEDVLAYSRQE
jgi:hypothetical protein